jgi:hypothetical protein
VPISADNCSAKHLTKVSPPAHPHHMTRRHGSALLLLIIQTMSTTTYHHASIDHVESSNGRTNIFQRFIHWCDIQEKNRLFWLGIALCGHGCFLTPATILAVVLAGTPIALFMTAMATMTMVLVTNLAAQPTKVTVPIFFLSVLVDLGIILSCVGLGYHASGAF